MKSIHNQSYHCGKADVEATSAYAEEKKVNNQAGENLIDDDALEHDSRYFSSWYRQSRCELCTKRHSMRKENVQS